MSAFADQVAVVTGAGSGIGRAIACMLAAERIGALGLVGHDPTKLQQVRDSSPCSHVRTVCLPADLAQIEDINQLAAQLRQQFSGIDILVHSAGRFAYGPCDTLPVACQKVLGSS
jgi:3-oxoacyl-[acyl-carrier protein] reductase